MSELENKKRFRFCPHCSREVSKTTYYHHKSLYRFRETGIVSNVQCTCFILLIAMVNVDDAAYPVDKIEVSSFEESSNGSDISW